jgi:hypothetical protein
MQGARSGGSRWGLQIWNQCVEENSSIYTVLGFWVAGKTRYFINFGIFRKSFSVQK